MPKSPIHNGALPATHKIFACSSVVDCSVLELLPDFSVARAVPPHDVEFMITAKHTGYDA